MATLVTEAALHFGCSRIYTSGACVSLTHHELKPRVCAVVSGQHLIREVRLYPNTILMSELAEETGGEGTITGLNGLLLGVAKQKGLESVCLMGEIPDWLAAATFAYPKASRSVLEVFSHIVGAEIDLSCLDRMESEVEEIIERYYRAFPAEMKERYNQRKLNVQAKPETITIQARIFVEEPSREGNGSDGERPS
jgi:hypothetical protein